MDLFRASFGHSVAGLFISPLSDQWMITMLIPFLIRPVPWMRSLTQLSHFTAEQRSLAWSPEPPFESAGAHDCRIGRKLWS